MAELKDIISAFNSFQDNVRGVALDRAVNEANDVVYQIRNSQAKEEEKIQGLRNLASDFTLRLTGMGVNPLQIEQVSKAVAPDIQNLKTPEDAALMGAAYGFPGIAEQGKKLIKDKQDFELKKLGLMTGAKQGKEKDKVLGDFQKAYAKTALKLDEGSKYANNIERILSLPEGERNPLEIGEALTQMPRAAGEVGRIPMQEREYFSGSMAAADRVAQFLEKNKESSFTDKNREALLGLIKIYKDRAENDKKTYGRLLTGQAKTRGSFLNDNPYDIYNSITGYQAGNPSAVLDGSNIPGTSAQSPSPASVPTASQPSAPAKKSYIISTPKVK